MNMNHIMTLLIATAKGLILWLFLASAPAVAGSWREAILLYAPMDGSADAVQSAGDGRAKLAGLPTFGPGRRAQGLVLPPGSGCSFDVKGNFHKDGGTLCAWVALNGATGAWDRQKGSRYQWLFGVRGATAQAQQRNDLRLFFDRGLTLQYTTAGPKPSSGSIYLPDLKWPAASWHHVGITFRARAIQLYIDGQPQEHTLTSCDALAAVTGRILLGCADEGGQSSLDGTVDEFLVLSRPLTAEEMKAVYLATGAAAANAHGKALSPLRLAAMTKTDSPPDWASSFRALGWCQDIEQYVRPAQATNDGPTLAASGQRPLHFLSPRHSSRGCTLAMWMCLPPLKAGTTTTPILSVRFQEPSGSLVNYEHNAVSQRLLTAVTDGERYFGGNPSLYRLRDAAWHHLALVVSADGGVASYLDGVLQEEARAKFLLREIAELHLPRPPAALAEALCMARALSATEIRSLFNHGLQGLTQAVPVKDAEKPYWDQRTAWTVLEGPVERLCLNGLWRFLPADGIEAALPAGRAWGYSRVPGSFSAVHFFKVYDSRMKPIPGENWLDGRGFTRWSEKRYDAGWYERACTVPAEWKGRRISVIFDPLTAYVARVFIGGQLVAHFEQAHPGEALLYPPRCVDLSSYAGQTVRLSLQVGWDNAGTCDQVNLGNVWLVNEPGWIDVLSVLPMTRVRPEKRIQVSAILRNSGEAAATISAAPRIMELDRTVVLTLKPQEVRLGPGETRELNWEQAWPQAHLWSPDDPHLYEIFLPLIGTAGKPLKEHRQRFGFREFWIDGRNFVLNGRTIHLRGSNCNLPCNYLYTHPDYVRRAFQARQALGYNLIQFWSDSEVSAMGRMSYTLETTLHLCDVLGIIAAVGNVSHLHDVRDEARLSRVVREFTRKYGAHAAVCLWFVNPNTCWYNYGMHPGNLDCRYSPAEGEPGFARQALARTAEQVVRSHDLQGRPVFTYASGNFGPIYSAMQYMSLGLPIQEEADWPSRWAEVGSKPLIPVETDLKWAPHWWDFESYERSWHDRSPVLTYYVEHAARYLGDLPYLRADHPAPGMSVERPEGILWHNLADEPYVLQVRALAARDILRGWRGNGMSGMTFHAEEDDLFATWSRRGEVFPPMRPAELQSPRPKPELKYQWFPRFHDLDRPNQPYHDAFKRNLAPLLAFIGGDVLEPERKEGAFTAKDHAYFAGEMVRKQVVVVNDRTDRDLTGRYAWEVVDAAGKIVQSGRGNFELPSGQIARVPFTFHAPAVDRRTDLTIRLKVYDRGQEIGEDTFALQVYPQPSAPRPLKPLALIDTPDGKTANALRAAGIPYRLVKSATDLARCRALVVGQEAFTGYAGAILNDLERSGTSAAGLNVLVLAQAPCRVANLRFEPAFERHVWPRDRAHPVLAGLEVQELANWRGASQLVPAYAHPDPKTLRSPHYPGLKWHWGNRGIVATWPFRKPAYGNFRVLADDGFDLVLCSLLEWLEGRGRIILCQLDLVDRCGTDPVATDLLRRLATYLQNAPPPLWKRTGYLGSEAGRKYLDPHRIEFEKDNARDLTGMDVLISDGVGLDARRTGLEAFFERGGTLVLVNANVETLKNFGLEAKMENVWRVHLGEGTWPLLGGVGPAELYWREARAVPVLAALPSGARATVPAVAAELPRGKGRLVVWTMNAGLYDDLLGKYQNPRSQPPRAYYARTSNHDKIHRALSLLLTNLGVRMQDPDWPLFCSPGRPRARPSPDEGHWPYLENLSQYDINAFHNW
jgi:hypothetical protein